MKYYDSSFIPTGVFEPPKNKIINEFTLYRNYPNPFNPTTTIEFVSEYPDILKLEVFNMLGENIAILFNDFAEPGEKYKFHFNGANLASGIYYISLSQGIKRKVEKMVLLK